MKLQSLFVAASCALGMASSVIDAVHVHLRIHLEHMKHKPKCVKHLSPEDKTMIGNTFMLFDTDKNSYLTIPELAALAQALNVKIEEDVLTNVFTKVDTSHDEMVSLDEFTAAVLSLDEDVYKLTFQLFDANGDGVANKDDASVSAGWDQTGFDTNGDGGVDYAEFKAKFAKYCRPKMCMYKLNKAEKAGLAMAFGFFDVDKDSFITLPDLAAQAAALGVNAPQEAVVKVFGLVDTNKDNKVSLDEFIAAVLSLNDDIYKLTFAFFDGNMDGVATKDEVMAAGSKASTPWKMTDAGWNEFDKDCDGKVTYAEFKARYVCKA